MQCVPPSPWQDTADHPTDQPDHQHSALLPLQVFAVAGQDPENRTDPMSYVFPRMAKCTFRSFGPSGTIQVRDMMCLIATNIINEKVSTGEGAG
ncbi:Innexin inx1 [Portunus trituberculatus]|uniref:Innexin inx1 n=1 Tax=Portunus trituberculatus TaxID=210409 RepID=A0A5B7IQM4_PORTR|nr:Innexin inx1 [Portunus trituberculatus]